MDPEADWTEVAEKMGLFDDLINHNLVYENFIDSIGVHWTALREIDILLGRFENMHEIKVMQVDLVREGQNLEYQGPRNLSSQLTNVDQWVLIGSPENPISLDFRPAGGQIAIFFGGFFSNLNWLQKHGFRVIIDEGGTWELIDDQWIFQEELTASAIYGENPIFEHYWGSGRPRIIPASDDPEYDDFVAEWY